MAKYRSKVNFAQIYSGDKHGYNLGLDGSIYIRQESSPRTFSAPRVGTQGKSTSDAAPSTDISGGTDTSIKIAVNGGAVVTATIASVVGLDTGAEIAAALETAINAALLADSQDGRVWVEFAGGLYVVHSQATGITSSVVITAAVSNNVADDLNLGLANSGLEVAGTDDQDFLLYTTGGPTFAQPVESNQHRSGRFHAGIIRKKKVCEFDFDTYINMYGSAGASIDGAVQLLIEAALGKKTVLGGTAIDFEQDLPIIYFSLVRVSTIFGEYYTGAYVKQLSIAVPGDAPGTIKYQGKASDASIAGLAKVPTGATSATQTVTAGESQVYTVGARVMIVAADGRTITDGVDGSLYVSSYTDSSNTVVLSASVTTETAGFIAPWDPGAVQQTGHDNIYTDLVGSMKLTAADSAVDVTNVELSWNNDHVDLDNRFGADGNRGFVPGNRATGELSVTFDLSNETLGKVIRTREFAGFSPEIIIGTVSSGRYLKITAPKWIVSVPTIEVPENGTTPVTLTGTLYQSAPGAKDPVKLRFG